MLRTLLTAAALAASTLAPGAVSAHGDSVGAIEITHPFATPTPPGARNGAAYLVRVENTGAAADRLVRASTPVAARTELHTMAVDAGGVMRMREVEAIELPPKATLEMRPGQGYHFMLMDLKQPLKEGDTFPMTLEFARAGRVVVKVVVQTPKPGPHHGASHPM